VFAALRKRVKTEERAKPALPLCGVDESTPWRYWHELT
jgi:hypothetical protein